MSRVQEREGVCREGPEGASRTCGVAGPRPGGPCHVRTRRQWTASPGRAGQAGGRGSALTEHVVRLGAALCLSFPSSAATRLHSQSPHSADSDALGRVRTLQGHWRPRRHITPHPWVSPYPPAGAPVTPMTQYLLGPPPARCLPGRAGGRWTGTLCPLPPSLASCCPLAPALCSEPPTPRHRPYTWPQPEGQGACCLRGPGCISVSLQR